MCVIQNSNRIIRFVINFHNFNETIGAKKRIRRVLLNHFLIDILKQQQFSNKFAMKILFICEPTEDM